MSQYKVSKKKNRHYNKLITNLFLVYIIIINYLNLTTNHVQTAFKLITFNLHVFNSFQNILQSIIAMKLIQIFVCENYTIIKNILLFFKFRIKFIRSNII